MAESDSRPGPRALRRWQTSRARTVIFVIRAVVAAAAGGALGLAMQLATGANGWAVLGATAGFAGVTLWTVARVGPAQP